MSSWGFGNLARLCDAETRSISAENPTGGKGRGGMATEGVTGFASRGLGPGWKVSPCIDIKAREVRTLAEIAGPGVIQHVWITTHRMNWRKLVLRVYWDGEESPSIEAPVGDFFAMGWNEHSNVASLPVCVNPSGGLNCYWPMPFSKGARITIENTTNDDTGMFFYQITYALTAVDGETGRLHAQFRRTQRLPYKSVYTIVDGIRGRGHYVGTYMAWQANNSGWWGEGEIKMYMDGDGEFPTICGTGTEDYFGGAWGFEEPVGTYKTYTTPFLGFHQHFGGDGETKQGRRFGLYRWHVMDPIHFKQDLRITMQALGIRAEREGLGRYLPLQDDIASVAFWYQEEPHAPFPALPGPDELEVT